MLASLLGHRLAHQLEGSLLGDVAERAKVLDGLLSRRVLLARNDASLVLHEVLLLQSARSVLRGAVEYFCFRAVRLDVHVLLVGEIL